MKTRQIDWEGGYSNIKCSVIGMFILLEIILEHMREIKDIIKFNINLTIRLQRINILIKIIFNIIIHFLPL